MKNTETIMWKEINETATAFKNIAKPFSIVAIALGALFTTALMVTGLVFAIIAIVKHVNPA